MTPAPLTSSERFRAYLVCLLGWTFDFYDLMLFAYLARAIGDDLAWGPNFVHDKALLVGLSLAVSGIGGIIFGGLADRYGRKRIMAWTILLYSLGTGLSGFAGGLVSLALLRAVTGLGVGGEWATGHALMAEIFPKEDRGKASAMLQAGEPIGVALAVLAGLWLEPRVGWRWVFWLSALPALIVFFIRSHVRESPLWLAHKPAQDYLEPYRRLFKEHGAMAFKGWVLGSSKLGTYWVAYVWLPEYFLELAAQGPGSAIAAGGLSALRLKFLLVAQGGQFLGMLGFGFFSDRFGRRPAFTFYSLLTGCGLFALAGFGAQLLAHPGWFWPAIGAVGVGSGCTAGFGALLAELFPTSIRNTAMGTVYNLSRSFQFVTQLAMGALVVDVGVAHGLFLAVFFAVFTAAWVWTFPETRGIPLDQS